MLDDIFVTGTGILTALGNGVAENLHAIQKKHPGISRLRYLQTMHSDFPVGEVKLSNEEMVELLHIPSDAITTRTSLMGMISVREALCQAGIVNKDNLRIALISGTTVGGMDKSEQYYNDFLTNDSKNAYIHTHDCGSCTEMIADHFGIFSSLQTISTACSSAANAIMIGALLLKSGRADIVVAGGSECITKFHLNGFNTLMILDRENCRPFDASRVGLNLGEGAAYIVMETGRTMNVRKTKPICRLTGYANTCDAYHQTASSPDGTGARLSMENALKSANLSPEDIDYINAHGTGTPNNDLSEGTAIQQLFKRNIPPVSSTKAFTGHTTSAAGGVEAVISILALQHNFIPVNLNFSTQMSELEFAPAISEKPEKLLKNVLSNSFGFGGNDTALIFSTLK